MAKPHYSPVTKKIARCVGRSCGYAAITPHFKSEAEGNAWLEERLAEEYPTIPVSTSKKTAVKAPQPKPITTELGVVEYRNAGGKLPREEGPAVVRPDGTKQWYRDGKRHREDGPAIVFPDGTEEWYRNGVRE